MGRLSLALLCCAAVIFIAALQTQARKCDPLCKSGCTKYGDGKCDRRCGKPRQYRLNKITRKCVPRCGGHCKKCIAPGHCAKCRAGFKIRSRGPHKKKCVTICASHCDLLYGCKRRGADKCDRLCAPVKKWRLRRPDYICVPRCDGYCLRHHCRSYRQCTKCRTGYSVITQANGDNICERDLGCDPNCVPSNDCRTQGKDHCDTTCLSGYVLNTVTYFCDPCAPDCVSCATNGGGNCDTCETGFALNGVTFQCEPCYNEHCTACDNPGECRDDASCLAHFDATGPTCEDCDANCDISGGAGCDNIGLCDPSPCNSGYGTTVAGGCGLCDANCANGCSTNGASKCDGTCNAGYVFDGTAKTCGACQTPDAFKCASCTFAGYCDGGCAGAYVETPPFSGVCV